MSPKPMFASSEGALEAPSTAYQATPDAVGPPTAPTEPVTFWSRFKARAAAIDARINTAIPQWKRMLFHVLAISLTAALSTVIIQPYVRGGIITFCLLLALAYEYGRKSRNNWFGRLCNKPIVREHEAHTRAASTDFGIAMAIVAMFYSPAIGVTAFLVAAWADPVARLVGQRLGRCRWPRSKKTLEGSLAGFLVAACLVRATYPGLAPTTIATVAALAMAVELIPETIIHTRFGPLLTPVDNFYIPVCTAATLAVMT